MRPIAIYLIRHGESEGNVNESIYKTVPDWQIGLTEKGKIQAQEASQELKRDMGNELAHIYLSRGTRIYCSPLNRARQTAQIISASLENNKIYEDPRLREQEWGNFAEDRLVLKIARERKKFGTFYYRIPNGESGADVYDRITNFIDTLHRDFEKEECFWNAVIVTHGLTLLIFLMRWYHWCPEEFSSFRTPRNCEIIKMQLNHNEKYDLITPLRRRGKTEEESINESH
jgi:broad specificity phosphatase PhoE